MKLVTRRKRHEGISERENVQRREQMNERKKQQQLMKLYYKKKTHRAMDLCVSWNESAFTSVVRSRSNTMNARALHTKSVVHYAALSVFAAAFLSSSPRTLP